MSMEEMLKKFPSAEQMDAQTAVLNRIANKMGAYEEPLDFAALQAQVRSGNVGLYLSAGDQIAVDLASMVTASTSGTGVTGASVNKDTFLAAAGTGSTDYEFTFDGAAWHYDGAAVSLATYGISITGTPAEGDTVLIHRTATAYDFDVLGIDEDVPVDAARSHVVSIQMHKVFSSINFDPPQFLYAVQAAAWPSGLPAGKYKVTLNHGAYGGGTGQDGTYVLTTTQTVPVGGGIRHGTMGVYQSSSYTKAQITGSTWTTYAADTLTTVETGIACTEYNAETDSDAVDLGTATASNPTYKSGDYINYTERNAYGSNRWSTSYIRQLLNSEDATLVWRPASIWSRNISATPEGFLHSVDPALRAVIGKVRKRYAIPTADGGGYEDLEDYCTLATMLDVGFGSNNSVSEGAAAADGTLKRSTAYTYWSDKVSKDRVKYLGSSASYWWLASYLPGSAHYVRNVNTSGALNHINAYSAYGVVPSLYII